MRLICIICREKFTPLLGVSGLECGHLFHSKCIGIWCKTNPTCPHCRFKVRGMPFPVELHINNNEEKEVSDSNGNELNCEFQHLLEEKKVLISKRKLLEEDLSKLREKIELSEKNVRRFKLGLQVWKREEKYAETEYDARELLRKENKALEDEISMLTRLNTLIYGSESEMLELIVGRSITMQTIEDLCTYVQVMKRKLKMRQKKYKEQESSLIHLIEETEEKILEMETKNKGNKQVLDKSVETDDAIGKVGKKN